MKNLVLFLFGLTLFACQQEQIQPTPPQPPTPTQSASVADSVTFDCVLNENSYSTNQGGDTVKFWATVECFGYEDGYGLQNTWQPTYLLNVLDTINNHYHLAFPINEPIDKLKIECYPIMTQYNFQYYFNSIKITVYKDGQVVAVRDDIPPLGVGNFSEVCYRFIVD